ncbi:MAG: 1-acyl-sn-glycerol-3-phosphate acyltransferase [Solirubrobacteraceae bacterium]
MPPTAVRRPVTITLWVLMSVLCLALSPLLLAIGAILASTLGRPQPLILARLVIAYFARELAVLAACGMLWLLSGFGWRMRSRRFQRLHYRLLRWFVRGIADRGLTLLDIEVVPQPSEAAVGRLRVDRPVLFFSRHAGPGDTVLLVDLLLSRYDRLPSVVFKDTLTIDPCVDLIGHRLPHAGLDTSDPEECQARIREVSAELGPRGVLLLFPEGGNFTPERRRRAIAKLRRKGRRREAAAGQQMNHVLPPHPTGALAALQGNPDADVIFGAHTGLGLAAFPRDLWRHPPIGKSLKTRMWLAPAAERPRGSEAQAQWLYDWWKQLDDWVDDQGEETSAGAASAQGG